MEDIKKRLRLRNQKIVLLNREYRYAILPDGTKLKNMFNENIGHYAWFLPNVEFDLEVVDGLIVSYALSKGNNFTAPLDDTRVNVIKVLLETSKSEDDVICLLQYFFDNCSESWLSDYLHRLLSSSLLAEESLCSRFLAFFASYFFIHYDYESDDFCAEFVAKSNLAINALQINDSSTIVVDPFVLPIVEFIYANINRGNSFFSFVCDEMLKYHFKEFLINVRMIVNLNKLQLISLVDNMGKIIKHPHIKISKNKAKQQTTFCFVINQVFQKELEVAEFITNLKQQKKLTADFKTIKQRTFELKKCRFNNNDLTLTDEQFQAVCMAQKSNFLAICGKPSTGKTVVINAIYHSLDKNIFRIIKSAVFTRSSFLYFSANVTSDCTTLYQMLKLGDDHWSNILFDITKRSNCSEVIDGDVLLLNDADMVDLDRFVNIAKYMRFLKKLVLKGDYRKLAPIGLGCVMKDICMSKSFSNNVVLELNKLMRPELKELDVFINAFDSNSLEINDLTKTYEKITFYDVKNEDEIVATIKRLFVARLKSLKQAATKEGQNYGYDLEKLQEVMANVQVIYPFRNAESCTMGVVGLNAILRAIYFWIMFSREVLDNVFVRYDKVIFINRNDDLNYAKGEIGLITQVDIKYYHIMLAHGRIVKLPVEMINDIDFAYTLTIHRMVGTKAREIIYLYDAHNANFNAKDVFYTAITCATNHLYLIGNPQNIIDFQNGQRHENFSYLAKLIDQKPSVLKKARRYLMDANGGIENFIVIAFNKK